MVGRLDPQSKTAARHLLRSLLREASYLPDEFAQNYIHNYIISRFRKSARLKEADATWKRFQDAKRILATLQRANMGEIKPLTSVLQKAYGRTGRRRRVLIDAIIRREPITLGSEKESTVLSLLNVDTVPEPSGSALEILIRSQAANHPPQASGSPAGGLIRKIMPDIPKENIWGRPMPLKRQANIERWFWADTLEKLLPPLPEVEWDRLRDLATGRMEFKGQPKRRSRAAFTAEGFEPTVDITELKNPVKAVARYQKQIELRVMNQHEITARFMRRIWASIWEMTPKMTYDGKTMKWTVQWGGGRSAASNGQVGAAGKADLELFEGIESLDKNPVGSASRTRHKGRMIDRKTFEPDFTPSNSAPTTSTTPRYNP